MEKSRWTLTAFDLSPEQRFLCPSFHASCRRLKVFYSGGRGGVSRGGGASGTIRCAVSASLRLLPAWARSTRDPPPHGLDQWAACSSRPSCWRRCSHACRRITQRDVRRGGAAVGDRGGRRGGVRKPSGRASKQRRLG